MSGIGDLLASIVKGISSLASSIVDGIGGFFDILFGFLNPASDNFLLKPIITFFTELLGYLNPFSEDFILKILFDWIKDLIYEVFVPDTDVINRQFNTTMASLNSRLGVTMFNLDNLFDGSASPSDINSNYYINGVGTLNLNFVNYKYLVDGVVFFRPYIRGFIVLMLFIFNIRQLLSMFGISSGEIASAAKEKEGASK